MYDSKTKTITFPHVIGSNVLSGVEYDRNCIDGGMLPINAFGLVPNRFIGGNVTMLGKIKKFGFYGCINRWNNKLIAFYVHDPNLLTDEGKKILERHYAGSRISYEQSMVESMSEEEKKRWEELKAEAREKGLSADLIDRSTAQGLVNALATIEKGINQKANAVIEKPDVSPVSKNPNIKTTVSSGNNPPAFEP